MYLNYLQILLRAVENDLQLVIQKENYEIANDL